LSTEFVNFIVYVIFANSIQPIKEFGGNPTIAIGFANVSRQKKANCSGAGPLGLGQTCGLAVLFLQQAQPSTGNQRLISHRILRSAKPTAIR
jgi:hypothetical protein